MVKINGAIERLFRPRERESKCHDSQPKMAGPAVFLVPIALLWRKAASVCFGPPKQFTLAACPLPQHGLAAPLARDWWRRILASDYCEFPVTTRGQRSPVMPGALREVVAGVLRTRQFVKP